MSARANNTIRLLATAGFQDHKLGPGQHLVREYPQGRRWRAHDMRRVKPKLVTGCRISPLWRRLVNVTVTVQPSHIREYTKDHFIWVRIWNEVSRSVGFYLSLDLGHRSWPQDYTSVLEYERESVRGYLVLQDIQ